MTKELILKKNNKQITLMDKDDIQSTYATKEEVNNITSGSNGVDITLINSKDEISSNGIYFYIQLPLGTFRVTGNSITLGKYDTEWLDTDGEVTIDWGDNTSDIVDNPITKLSHTYTDGLNTHDIKFIGKINSIGEGAFIECNGLISAHLPPVTTLGSDCFYYCENLQNIVLPDNLESIGSGCFEYCSSLSSIELPLGLYEILTNAFNHCTSLSSISIPSSVDYISNDAFYECYNLKLITIYSSTVVMDGTPFIIYENNTKFNLYWDNVESIPSPNWFDYSTSGITGTIFTIPKGTIEDYVSNDYPRNQLQERD